MAIGTCFNGLAEFGSPVPNHVGVDTYRVLYFVSYFIVFC
jgi:hypothetical protein